MSTSPRFPTVKALAVDELLEHYDGIIGDADKALDESRIAGALPVPPLFAEAEKILQWAEHEDPLPPDDLTEVDSAQLGQLFSFFQNWTNYVAAQVTRAKCIRDILDRKSKVVKAALTLYYKNEQEVPISLIDDHITVDARYVLVDASHMSVRVFYETAKSREEQLRRTLNTISREQTRRGEELQRLLHDEHGGEAGLRSGLPRTFTKDPGGALRADPTRALKRTPK